VTNLGKPIVFLALLAAMLGGAVVTATKPAEAIPVFAHRYGLTCQTCHTVVPHLTQFGQSFLAHGYRIPGVNPGGAFPISVRTDFTYQDTGTADPDATTTGPLPKIIVNEIELLTGGSIGSRVSYWGEQYIVDGGFPGRLRELWATYSRFRCRSIRRRSARRPSPTRFGVKSRATIRSTSLRRSWAAKSRSAIRRAPFPARRR